MVICLSECLILDFAVEAKFYGGPCGQLCSHVIFGGIKYHNAIVFFLHLPPLHLRIPMSNQSSMRYQLDT